MKASVSNLVKKTAKAAANEATRPILSQVKITNKEAVAADGFILVIRNLGQGNELAEGEEILVPARILQNSIFNLKKGNKNHLLIETHGSVGDPNYNPRVEVSTASLVGLTAPMQTGKFPDHQKLYDGEVARPETLRIGFTVEVLKKLLNAIDDAKFVTFRISDNTHGVVFKAGDSKGIIMPAMTNHARDDSSWDKLEIS